MMHNSLVLFPDLTTISTQRAAQLEFGESKHRWLVELSRGEELLTTWTARHGDRDSVDDMLKSYMVRREEFEGHIIIQVRFLI